MTDLCSVADVLARPELVGSPISDTDERIPGYVTDASVLIEGYLEHSYPDPPAPPETSIDPVPNAARVVCARVVARVLTTPRTAGTLANPNTDSYTHGSTMGPFAHSDTQHVTQDALGGGVWLTKQDKMALDVIGSSAHAPSHMPMYELPRYATGLVNILHGPTGRPCGDETPPGWYG